MKKAKITKIGHITPDGFPIGFTFDCEGGLPGFSIDDDGVIRCGGWTADELCQIVKDKGEG